MKCRKCNDANLKSIVFYPGIPISPDVENQPFYDKLGRMHHHDSNSVTALYRCSRGHNWTEKTTGDCWCGWTGEGSK